MALQSLFNRSDVQPGSPGLRGLTVSQEQWRQAAFDLSAAGARLLALWAGGAKQATHSISAVFVAPEARGLILTLPMVDADEPYPGVENLLPAASGMQRAITDLSGIRSTDPDTRPWLRHTAWPQGYRPLLDPPSQPIANPVPDSYS